jgi:ubiquinone/menaquinone biosynthesis C-methylase UbiE
MTEATTERASRAGHGARLTTITTRFEDLVFPPASFDLIASAMSLHHIADKAPIYRRFADWIAPGGALRIADQFLGATESIQQKLWDLWLAFCREPGHCTEEEIQTLVEHAKAHDHYEPLDTHFAYLKAAGFRFPDCIWRNGMYAVLTAERP